LKSVPQVLKPLFFAAFAARLKPCPFKTGFMQPVPEPIRAIATVVTEGNFLPAQNSFLHYSGRTTLFRTWARSMNFRVRPSFFVLLLVFTVGTHPLWRNARPTPTRITSSCAGCFRPAKSSPSRISSSSAMPPPSPSIAVVSRFTARSMAKLRERFFAVKPSPHHASHGRGAAQSFDPDAQRAVR